MKLKNIMNEIKKGDYVDSMGEIGLVNKVKGRVAYVKFDSNPKSFHPIMASALKKSGKKHKGKDLYTESVNEGKLNKKDVAYQLSIDYSGNTKPKVTKLNKKGMTVFYGYKVNPKDVIKSLNKLEPSMKIKHKGWSINSQGGGTHSFIFESNDLVFNHGKFGGTGKPWPQTEPNEFAYLDFKKWAKKMEPKIKKQMSILNDQRIFRAMEFVWQTWDKQANKGAFSNIKGTKFGRALVKMMWNDNLVFDKKSNKIIKLKELLENKND